ncbi:MAG: dihydroorotase [Bacteroidaceae bacterium]|nr:dihydroorotase [Bacteroidaceae bacterium]
MNKTELNDIIYVSDGRIRRADITIEGEYIARINDKEEFQYPKVTTLLLPGIIDDHVHSREPGMTRKGDLTSETRAAAAGGVTSILDMPNVVPATTSLETLTERQKLGRQKAYVNYSFYFGATNTNAHLLRELNPELVPGVKLFMGSSTGGMLVDHGEALRAIFEQSPLLIMAHCEDTAIINRNMQQMQQRYGDDPPVELHPQIRSEEACMASSSLAVQLAEQTGARLHLAHITTARELRAFANRSDRITLEACLPHLLFCDDDYVRLGTRIKCNPAVKTRADRDALRQGLTDGSIALVATDHAPHLLEEKQGGSRSAVSGMPMVQFSLVSMLQLADEGVLPLERVVELMCHAPSRLFHITDRGFIREGMKADLTLVSRTPWTLTSDIVVSRCGWSPLEGRTFDWRVEQTYCNGQLIYDKGQFSAADNAHAQPLHFSL